ncbi:RDD family protein [Marinomonas sp. THO17]|uniref:RDD family protein n=1 Tax=Marinomonas sp. THO17 TaxID=3149048 RepID=UPI00336C208F
MDKETIFDTTYLVETPESIDLSAKLAGPFPRILAFVIDLAIRYSILGVLLLLLMFAGDMGWGIFLILLFMFEWFYPVLFEVLRNGQTPGKKKLGIMVVNDDLTPVTWSTSLLRNLLRAADFLPLAYVFGIFSISLTSNFQRLGDLAAGSIVIYKDKETGVVEDLPDVEELPPPVELSVADQVAITEFVRRRHRISESRQIELANLLTDVSGKSGKEAVNQLQSIGLWLLGGKH